MASIPQWTWDDHKRFELALAQFPERSPSLLEDVAQHLQKPLEEVKYYYQFRELVHDVALIESGKAALPKYPEDDYVSLAEASRSIHGEKDQVKRANPWTPEEHSMASIPQWTRDDDKRFQEALVQFPEGSSSLLEDVAQLLQKPFEEVKYYYDALVYDVELIESGKVALPKYPEDDYVSLTEATQSKHLGMMRKKGIPWSTEEHRLFLEGLKRYGKVDPKMISREFVKTRTPRQVSSHAQAYFARQNLDNKKGKRSSILDISLEFTTGKPDLGKQNPDPEDDESQGSCLGI